MNRHYVYDKITDDTQELKITVILLWNTYQKDIKNRREGYFSQIQ